MLYDLYIYGAIGEGGVTADYVKTQLESAKKKKADYINVHISSPGGEVYEGYTIYNLLKNSGFKINTLIEGFCASIATLIALAGEEVTMNKTASFMIHNPFVGVEGDANTLRQTAEHLDTIKKELVKVYKERTGISEAELWVLMDNETYYTAEGAQGAGFVKVVNEANYKAVAYFQLNQTTNKMDKPILEVIRGEFASIKNSIAKLMGSPKNIDTTLEDGTAVFIETEGDILGASIYTVAEDGTYVPLTDGEYVLADGTAIVVVGGAITEVMPAAEASTDVEALQAENAALKAEIAAKSEEVASLKASNESNTAALAELNAKIESVMAKLPAGEEPKAKFTKTFKAIESKEVKTEEPLSHWAKSVLAENVRS
jgi:ATP-dependent protease ClpP protease subunit